MNTPISKATNLTSTDWQGTISLLTATYTLTALAKATGTSVSQLSRLHRGIIREPRFRTGARLLVLVEAMAKEVVDG